MKKVEYKKPETKIRSIKDIDSDKLLDSYKKFIEEPIEESLYSRHKIKPNEVIIRVFDYMPKPTGLVLTDGSSSSKLKYMTFPIAKVLHAGGESKFKSGDFVRLRDMDVASTPSGAWALWKKANDVKPLGSTVKMNEPPKYTNNLLNNNYFLRNMFQVDPLGLDGGSDFINTFKVNEDIIDSDGAIDPYSFI